MSSTSTATAEELEAATGLSLTPKGRATRARIIEAAAVLIFERGVAGTAIDDVRRAAEVSGSQMTHYFQDKRSLVHAVIGYQLDAILEFHTQPRLGKLDSLEALRLWADLNIEKAVALDLQGGCSFGSLAAELAESDARMRADLAAGYDRWAAVMRSGLAAMRRRGVLRTDAKPDVLASVLMAAHQGGSLISQTKRDVKPLRDALDAALEYVYSFAVDGVQPPRPRRRVTNTKPSSSGAKQPTSKATATRRAATKNQTTSK
ncbi:MAG: putative TetR-family transcriptional regulator [Frankiales bacterium]|nr:putative TetR-family transcriptional regulator [Frankiales bacterium]